MKNKVLIIGSGKMGSNLFHYLSAFPIDIVWLCLDENEKQPAEQNFQKRAGRKLRTGLISQNEYDDLLSRVVITCDITLSRDCNLIIEAIWENEQDKQQLFAKLDGMLPADAIITSNTSSVPVSKLIPSEKRKKYFAGLHFFFPVEMHNIVEINITPNTEQEVVERIIDFLNTIERKGILLDGSHHFLLNRLQLPVQNEAYNILKEGLLTVPEIDALVRSNLFPLGIFEFFDHVGIAVMLASVKNYSETYPDGTDYSGLMECLNSLAEQGMLGVKSGRGFYQYPLSANTIKIDPDKAALSGDMVKRLNKAFYEAVLKAEKEKIMSPEELDFALVEYWGFEGSVFEMGKKAGYDF